jgi:hypothetical protein
MESRYEADHPNPSLRPPAFQAEAGSTALVAELADAGCNFGAAIHCIRKCFPFPLGAVFEGGFHAILTFEIL